MSTDRPYRLRDLIYYFLRLGTLGFGGPVALVGYMHRDLVEKKRWISEEDYKEGLALAQLAPGPLAAQLGIFLGYVDYGISGATLTGLAFVLPSFLMVVALGVVYRAFGGLPWVQAVFYGVGASVIGIIVISAYKLTRKTVGKDRLLWALYLIAVAVTAITESEEVGLFIGAGLLYWLIKAPPRIRLKKQKKLSSFFPATLVSFAAILAAIKNRSLWQLFLFFSKAGAFVFGSGLAIVPFLYGGVVKEYGWLNEQQFIDAVAVAMITPGPVVITVGFIGYLVAGFPGAVIAALGTFLPCYLFTIIPAPYFKKYGRHPGVKAFVDGITAAAIGAITGAVIILSKRTLTDIPTILLALGTVFILSRFKNIPEPYIILAAALTGIVLKLHPVHWW